LIAGFKLDLRPSGVFLSVDEDGCPETPTTNYQSTLRNIPEERRSHRHNAVDLRWLKI